MQAALSGWLEKEVPTHHGVLRIGTFGSYALGNWGVASDLDLLIIVEQADKPFERRAADWKTEDLRVLADVLVYTKEEWGTLAADNPFHRRTLREVVWLYPGA